MQIRSEKLQIEADKNWDLKPNNNHSLINFHHSQQTLTVHIVFAMHQ
jgi:hypothetical protein